MSNSNHHHPYCILQINIGMDKCGLDFVKTCSNCAVISFRLDIDSICNAMCTLSILLREAAAFDYFSFILFVGKHLRISVAWQVPEAIMLRFIYVKTLSPNIFKLQNPLIDPCRATRCVRFSPGEIPAYVTYTQSTYVCTFLKRNKR